MKWCSYCGSHDHNIEYCPKTWDGQINLRLRYCDYCGSKDHTYEECKKHA